MGFWIFMLIMELLMPLTIIGFGKYFSNQTPKEINSAFGCRRWYIFFTFWAGKNYKKGERKT